MESEQPQPQQQPVGTPRAHVNWAGAQGGAFDLGLLLGDKQGDADPIVLAHLAVSWEFVPILIRLLQEQLDEYEKNVGEIRDLQAREQVKEGT